MTDVDTTFSLSSNSDYVEALLDNIRGYLSLTDHEVGILRETNRILREPTPTTQLGLENRVSVLDQCRTDLVNLLYMIEDRLSRVEFSYRNVYDPEFTRLTRAGRPSQQAIDSEIHSTIEKMSEWRDTINHYEFARNLLLGYLKSISASKETCMKKWGFA